MPSPRAGLPGAVSIVTILVLALAAAAGEPAARRLQNPPARPELFARGRINTDADEYGPTVSPDGRELYFVRRTDRQGRERLMVAALSAAGAEAPRPLVAEDEWGDKDPYPSLDGRRLFFASRRPLTAGGAIKDYDLWVLDRVGTRWSTPRHLGTPPNSATYDNYPAVARNGNLYFASHRLTQRNDLFVSPWMNGAYLEPEPLSAVNTAQTDADPYVAPDESYLIFSSDRPHGKGEGDLYITFNRGGRWSPPRSLGDQINTATYEYTPFITPDGKAFFFSRDWGEIWWVSTASLNLKP